MEIYHIFQVSFVDCLKLCAIKQGKTFILRLSKYRGRRKQAHSLFAPQLACKWPKTRQMSMNKCLNKAHLSTNSRWYFCFTCNHVKSHQTWSCSRGRN